MTTDHAREKFTQNQPRNAEKQTWNNKNSPTKTTTKSSQPINKQKFCEPQFVVRCVRFSWSSYYSNGFICLMFHLRLCAVELMCVSVSANAWTVHRKDIAKQWKLGSFFGNWIKGHEKIKREGKKQKWMSLYMGWPAGFRYEFLKTRKSSQYIANMSRKKIDWKSGKINTIYALQSRKIGKRSMCKCIVQSIIAS